MIKLNKTTGIINSNGICSFCKTKNIEHGVLNGFYWNWCHKCDKTLTKREVLIDKKQKHV